MVSIVSSIGRLSLKRFLISSCVKLSFLTPLVAPQEIVFLVASFHRASPWGKPCEASLIIIIATSVVWNAFFFVDAEVSRLL